MNYDLKLFKISIKKRKAKYPDIYYFPKVYRKQDEKNFEYIDKDLCSGDYKDFCIECEFDIPELKKCSEMGLYEFTKFYWSIYDNIFLLYLLTSKDELSTLIECVTNDFSELVDIVKKGEYHFYSDTFIGEIADEIYHQEIGTDEFGAYKYKPDILIDKGYIEKVEGTGVIKFFDTKFLKEAYTKRHNGGAQNESEFTTSEQE